MNNVHELGPNGDSETALSRKLGRKLSRVHITPNWPNWAHRLAQARACLAVSWALRPCRGRGPRLCRRHKEPYRGRSNAVSWAQAPCRSALCRAPGSRVLGYLAIQPCLKPAIHYFYCNSILAKPATSVTIQFFVS